MSLPDNPNLEHLRNQARRLQRGVRGGVSRALELVRSHGTAGTDVTDLAAFPLHAAQLVVARAYGFASWACLKQYVEVAVVHGWQPGDVPADESRADAFCRYACLTYADGDGPDRRARARAILDENGAVSGIWAAAAAGAAAAVRSELARDPGLARREGGPYRWTPLCYLAYSRVVTGTPQDTADIVRALLDAGADPDEGHLWNGQPYPFTVLTGLFGDGQLGSDRHPPHPHANGLARLVLAAGADPNDSQALYNRMFAGNDDHLRLLFEFGLGTGDGGPWRRRLGDRIDTPVEMLRAQLRWAVEHGMAGRVELLGTHGVDVRSPYGDGRTPADLARLGGYPSIVDILGRHGSGTSGLDPVDGLIAAVFAPDAVTVQRIRDEQPDVVTQARERRPGLIVWAASRRRADVVATLAGLGWDVDAMGRGDTPVEQRWQTALHEAAGNDDVALVDLLLSLGADPAVRDKRFGGTPLDWARYFDHEAATRRLESADDHR